MKRCREGITAYLLLCLTGFAFFFCGQSLSVLEKEGNLIWTTGYTVRVSAVSVAAGVLTGTVLFKVFQWLNVRAGKQKAGAAEGWRLRHRLLFAGSFLGIVLTWLPAWLAYYPAICSYDMPIQTGQVVEHYYIDHHPIAHTFLLKCFMNLGTAIGSVTDSIGLFAFLQLAFLAAAFACGVTYLAGKGSALWKLVVLQLWCMFYPFHWYMAVSLTKDTIFTGFFVLTVISLLRLSEKQSFPRGLAFFLSGIGMILFRNNGKYAFLVLLGTLILAALFGKERKSVYRILTFWGMGTFLAGSLLLGVIFRVSGAEQGDKREMLSMPIQQLSRTMLYHGGVGALPEDDNTMEEADRTLIQDFILNEGYKNYKPEISDPVKSNTNTYVVRYRTGEFLTTWLRLFKTYPGDFINAALLVNAGYLYPEDTSHARVNVTGDSRKGRGYVQTCWEEETMNARGIYKASKWHWLQEKLEKWADENGYLRIPVVKYLFVPGVWLWFYLLAGAWRLLRKEYPACLPLMLAAGYFATLLLGPTVQLRYLYPLMAAFPFLLLDVRRNGRIGE